MTACLNPVVQELLLSRYPDLLFRLTCEEKASCTLSISSQGTSNIFLPSGIPLHDEDLMEESRKMLRGISLSKIEVLYIYGVGVGHIYLLLENWLKEKPERVVIFVEEKMEVLEACLQGPFGQLLLAHPQIHLSLQDPQMWKEHIQGLTETFFAECIACTTLPFYKRTKRHRFAAWKLQLLRTNSAVYLAWIESLHPHKIFANVWANLHHLHRPPFYANALREKFSSIPAVICGAGPSLQASCPHLKALENKAMLIAGGSAIKALSHAGISPHLMMAVDPNYEEFLRLQSISNEEIPFIYSNRLHADILPLMRGPIGYLRSDTGGVAESWFEEQLGIEGVPIGPELGSEAFSITTLAAAYAFAMGCDPIVFVGVDLAYTGMVRYTEGVTDHPKIKPSVLRADPRALEKLLVRRDIHGKSTFTLLKWIMEAEVLGTFAKDRPNRRWINATGGGIGLPGIPNRSLEETVALYCTKEHLVRQQLKTEISKCQMPSISKEQLKEIAAPLWQSLERYLEYVHCLLKEIDKMEQDASISLENGKTALITCELEGELSRKILFPAVEYLLDRFLSRTFHSAQNRDHILRREKRKWSSVAKVIEEFLNIVV